MQMKILHNLNKKIDTRTCVMYEILHLALSKSADTSPAPVRTHATKRIAAEVDQPSAMEELL